MNGYGTIADDNLALQSLRLSASGGWARSKAYLWRLHKACGLLDEAETTPWKQYLDQMARIGFHGSCRDLESAISADAAGEAKAWLRGCTGGVGAPWYGDSNMLHGLVMRDWRDHDALMSRARRVNDVDRYAINLRGDTILHFAAACGEWRSLRALVTELHADVNCKNSAGDTPLISACRARSGQTAIILLKDYKADASIAANNGETALHWLSQFDATSIPPLVNDLISCGANVNAITKERITHSLVPGTIDCEFQMPGPPLLWAVHDDRPDIVKVLLEKGANSYWCNDECLRQAAFYHHVECLEAFIHFREKQMPPGGDARKVVLYGPLLWYAVHSADKFSMILRNGPNYLDRLHTTLAFLREKTELINVRGSTNHDGKDHGNIFYCAVTEAHDEVVRYFLESDWHSEYINEACGNARRTPILEAVRWNRRHLVELLKAHEADIFAKCRNPFAADISDWSAIHVFAHEGFHELTDISMLEYLVVQGLPVDGVTDPLGTLVTVERLDLNKSESNPPESASELSVFLTETSLSCALRKNCFKICDELLRLGADPNALSLSAGLFTSTHPTTVLGHAIISNGRYSLPKLEYLLSISEAASEVTFLVEPERRLTAFHRAAMGFKDIVTRDSMPVTWAEFDWITNQGILQELLEHVSFRQHIDDRCAIHARTALHLGVRNLNAEAVKLLLRAGANATIRDGNGDTALDLCGYVEPESEKQVDALVSIRAYLDGEH